MVNEKNREHSRRSNNEKNNIEKIRDYHKFHIDKWGDNWGHNALITIQRQTLSRILYYNLLYQKIVGVPGCILEFGVQWGSTLAQLIALRGIYEPYNHSRHIYGFDTFEGFFSTSENHDGSHLRDTDYSVYSGYEKDLEEILKIHENNCPLSHIKKFSLIKGDVSKTSLQWTNDNPQAIVAMAIFDMDIYQPTKDALTAILPRLTRGSLLIFDELNCSIFPGETEAVKEVLGLNNLKLEHYPHAPNCAWVVWD